MVNRVMRAPADVSTPRIRTMGNGSSRVGGKDACNPAAGVAAGGVVVSLGVAVGPGVGVGGGGAAGAAWMTSVCSSAWCNTLVSLTLSSTQSFEPMSAAAATYVRDVAPSIGLQSLSSVAEHRSHCQLTAGTRPPDPLGPGRERLPLLRRPRNRDQRVDGDRCVRRGKGRSSARGALLQPP